MLTIPTVEFLGLITDVIGFGPDEKTDPHHGVLLHWNGECLRASATDVLSAGISTWTPGEGQEQYAHTGDAGTKATDELDPRWGPDGGGNWAVFVPHADAKTIVKVYKIAAKFALTPLTVETNISGTRLIVARAKQAWCSGNTMTIDTPDYTTVAGFPDIASIVGRLRDRWADGAIDVGVGPMLFSPVRLGRFGAVRGWGGEFLWLGDKAPTLVRIGSTFAGFIFPVGKTAGEAANAIKMASGLGEVDLAGVQAAVDEGLLEQV